MTRRRAVATALVVLAGVNVAGWAAYLLHEPLPSSVWVRRRSSWTDERREVVCDAPSGTALGDDWRALRQCGSQFTPHRVIHDGGETTAGVEWLRRRLGVRSRRFIEYERVDRTVERDDDTWIEYVRADR